MALSDMKRVIDDSDNDNDKSNDKDNDDVNKQETTRQEERDTPTGCRVRSLVIACDGVWDLLDPNAVALHLLAECSLPSSSSSSSSSSSTSDLSAIDATSSSSQQSTIASVRPDQHDDGVERLHNSLVLRPPQHGDAVGDSESRILACLLQGPDQITSRAQNLQFRGQVQVQGQ